MKKLIYLSSGVILFALFLYGCTKNETEFKNYFDGHEIVYTGAVGDVITQPGNLRVGLKWKASTDPSINKYIVYWNNKADSQVVNIAAKVDTVRTVVTGLSEFVYSFSIYSFDAKGNKSIAKEINNVKVYGAIYAATLLNRGYDVENAFNIFKDGSVKLNFITADTINTYTEIKYTNNANEAKTAYLSGDSASITLKDVKLGAPVTYRSAYIPERTSIDTFKIAAYSTYPTVDYRYVKADKGLFKELSIANDVGVYDSNSTRIRRLWDNSNGPQGYPDIYHSDGDHRIPHQLTFDMGKLYGNLGQMEETGRNCCNNPDQYEVWGIDNIEGHDTNIKPNENGWKEDMIAKGWVLLKDVVRTDDGQAPYKFDLTTTDKSIRYIRIRVKHVVTGDSYYSNMSEITFWNKE
jgi:hypothetical protein